MRVERDASVLECADTIAERERFLHVVRDDDDRLAKLPPDPLELRRSSWRVIASSAPNGSSIRTIGGSTASARATPTRWRCPPDSSRGHRRRELRRRQVRPARAVRGRARDARSRWPPFEARHERDVLLDREVRKQADLLQHVAGSPPERDRIPFARVASLDAHASGIAAAAGG